MPATTSLLKGKARKEVKQKDATAANGSQKTTILQTTDLGVFARIIANSKNSVVKVLLSIIRAGLRAVTARQEIADQFEEYADKDLEVKMSNERHRHFIDVLEEILAILEPCVEAQFLHV
ncbi:MAG: hypothetical protein MMC33_005992 [Icmadophila ericetorum]|nr:hypothetical protein [Icmadophila ericetorum]